MPAVPYTAEEFLSPQTLARLDETVAETFGVMLGLAASHVADSANEDSGSEEERTGLIGFSGALRGSCEVRMDTAAARAIASAMLGGSPIAEGDEDSINDSVGEICNMIAAGWKNRVEALSGKCFLSPPTVISGKNYKVHLSYASLKVDRHYFFEAHTFQVSIHCVEIAAG